MGIEAATWIEDLVETNPAGADDYSTADDHIRLVKDVLNNQFTSLGAVAVAASAAEINQNRPHIGLKTANEVVNNSVALQDDDHMLVTGLTAGKAFRVYADINFTCADIAAGIRFHGAATGGTETLANGYAYHHIDPFSIPSSSVASRDSWAQITTLLTTDTAQENRIILWGIFVSNTATGFKLRWAQNVATVADTTILKYSFLELRQLD